MPIDKRAQTHPRNMRSYVSARQKYVRTEKNLAEVLSSATEFCIFRPWISAEGAIKKFAHDTSPYQ